MIDYLAFTFAALASPELVAGAIECAARLLVSRPRETQVIVVTHRSRLPRRGGRITQGKHLLRTGRPQGRRKRSPDA